MPDPKKQSLTDQIVGLLRDLVTEPVTDQSSKPPTRKTVRRVKAVANPRRRKVVKKPRPKATAKKKRATTARKTTRRKAPGKKKTARK
jgi:hypothetical protein